MNLGDIFFGFDKLLDLLFSFFFYLKRFSSNYLSCGVVIYFKWNLKITNNDCYEALTAFIFVSGHKVYH